MFCLRGHGSGTLGGSLWMISPEVASGCGNRFRSVLCEHWDLEVEMIRGGVGVTSGSVGTREHIGGRVGFRFRVFRTITKLLLDLKPWRYGLHYRRLDMYD